MKTVTEIPLNEILFTEISILVDQLQSCPNSSDKYQIFQAELELILVADNTCESDLLPSIIEWKKATSHHKPTSPYWDYAIEVLGKNMREQQPYTTNDGILFEQSKHSASLFNHEDNPGWTDINSELANLEDFIKRIKSIQYLRPLVDFLENMESHQIRLNKLFKKVWRVTRTLLLFGILDKLFFWLKENHKERRFIVEMATILLFTGKVLWLSILVIGYILNPVKFLRKLLSCDIDDALPID